MKVLDKITGILQKIELGIGTVVVAGIFLLTTINIFMRYALNSPIFWAEEVILYSFIWMGYLTAAYTLSKDQHVRFTLITDALSPKAQLIMKAIWDILIAVGFVLLYPSAIKVIDFLIKTPALQVPEKYFYMIVPIGYALIIIHTLINFSKRIFELKEQPAAIAEKGAN